VKGNNVEKRNTERLPMIGNSFCILGSDDVHCHLRRRHLWFNWNFDGL